MGAVAASAAQSLALFLTLEGVGPLRSACTFSVRRTMLNLVQMRDHSGHGEPGRDSPTRRERLCTLTSSALCGMWLTCQPLYLVPICLATALSLLGKVRNGHSTSQSQACAGQTRLIIAALCILWALALISLTLALSGPLGGVLDARSRKGPSKLQMTIMSGVASTAAIFSLASIVSAYLVN